MFLLQAGSNQKVQKPVCLKKKVLRYKYSSDSEKIPLRRENSSALNDTSDGDDTMS